MPTPNEDKGVDPMKNKSKVVSNYESKKQQIL